MSAEDPMRALTRALFTDPDAPTEAPPTEATAGNRVPREGNTPTVTDPHAEMREFIRGLFERAD